MRLRRKSAVHSTTRRGAVLVEFALAFPVLIFTVFAGIEFARVNMMRNTIENAAYAGAREGIVPGATKVECEAAAQAVIDLMDIDNATVVADPFTDESVTLTVTVPLTTDNGYVTPKYYLGKSLVSQITLPRERVF